MASVKVLLFTLMFTLASSGGCLAEGSMSVKIGATASFVYVQMINAIDGYFAVHTDVTHKVPYEIQSAANEKMLVIQ